MKTFNKDGKWYFAPQKSETDEGYICDEANEFMNCTDIECKNCVYNFSDVKVAYEKSLEGK